MTTRHDITQHRQTGKWRALERLAKEMVADAQSTAGVTFTPHLGGGTRLMFALEHRISDDIDLFVRDMQWIGYLTPRLNDRFEDRIDGYVEGGTSLKFRLPEGEIDFIVGLSLLGLEPERVPDTTFLVEPIAEVLAKKLFYRGHALAPRDLFDWFAIEHLAPDSVADTDFGALLGEAKLRSLSVALETITLSVKAVSVWTAIQAPDKPPIEDAVSWAKGKVAGYHSCQR